MGKLQNLDFYGLFEALVPDSGAAETVAGEIIRAVSRIEYRFWNDGDKAGVGYGKETVNPAVRYLYHLKNSSLDRKSLDREIVYFMNCIYNGSADEAEYEKHIESLKSVAVELVKNSDLASQPNDDDYLSHATSDDADHDYYDEEEYLEPYDSDYEFEDDDM